MLAGIYILEPSIRTRAFCFIFKVDPLSDSPSYVQVDWRIPPLLAITQCLSLRGLVRYHQIFNIITSVQTRCIAKFEAQKSALFRQFVWGGF